MPRALLIDDEASARQDLRVMLAAHPEIEIVGESATVKTACARLAADDYDVVFLDIQLVGGSGFEVAAAVRAGARIIFVTAHNQHALRAFEVNALDYLLKPVAATRLAAAVARLVQPRAEPAETPTPLAFRGGDVVHLASGGQTRFVALEQLAAIESQENYTLVHLTDATRVLVRRSLKAWEEALPGAVFLRVHRQVIVNLHHVAGFQRDGARAVRVKVNGCATEFAVSREHWPELKLRLPGSLPGS